MPALRPSLIEVTLGKEKPNAWTYMQEPLSNKKDQDR